MSRIFTKTKTERGFTLMETVVYVSLFVIISAMVINFVLMVAGSWSHGRAEKNVSRIGRTTADRLAHEIRLAGSVDVNQSVFDSNPGKLVLNTFTTATSSSPSVTEIYLVGGEINIKQGTGQPVSINGGSSNVTSLVFNRMVSLNSESVRASFTVEAGAGRFKKQKNITIFGVLRNSYK